MKKMIKGKNVINNQKVIPKGYKKTKYGIAPDDWKIVKVREVFKRVRNPVNVQHYEDYKEIGIRSHGKGIFYKKPIKGKELGNKSVFWVEPDCFIVNIVFAWEMAIAKTTCKDVGYIASHRFPMYRPKKNKLNLDFITYFFKSSLGKHLLNLASPGGAGRNKTLGQKAFGDLDILIPNNVKEQMKIAEIILTWDKAIELKEKLIEQKKEQKKGLMQKLLTGEVRLSGFEEKWLTVRLKDIVIGKGNYGLNAPSVEKNKELPTYLRITDISDEGYIRSEGLQSVNHPDSSNFYLEENDIVFARTGASTGKTYLYDKSDGELAYAGFLIRFKLNPSKVIPSFIKYYTQTEYYHYWVKVMSMRSGQPGINAEEYGHLPIYLPSKNEQRKIANIFSTLDKVIMLTISEVKLLKQQKKGLMQRLLTGKIRVKV